MTVDEQNLVERARRGEIDAFQSLVERYKKMIYSVAYDMTGTRQDAEDISQEVFLKAYISLKRFRGDSKFSSWLYRIAVNTCLDARRKSSIQTVELEQDRDGKVFELPLKTEDAGPDTHLERQELQQTIDRALEELTDRERTVFVLRHYNDLMLKEIAEVLEISEGTVKSLLFRALRRLRKVLAPYHSHLGGSN